MKKIFLKMLVACLLISSLNIALFAETKTLWRVTVFDKFNYGPVTTAKYNYSALPVDNLPDTFKKQMKPIYGGGILSERKIIQGGRNFR